MMRLNGRSEFLIKRILDSVRAANIEAFGQAGSLLMRVARAMIITSRRPSKPGAPPHSRRGQLRRAVRYELEREGVVIGPTAEGVGLSATAHEFGGSYRGGRYPERQLMGPALERVMDRLPGHWEASVRG